MKLWAAVILIVALAGTIFNLTMSIPPKLVLHDILLFLVTLGMLVSIRSAKTNPATRVIVWAAIALILAFAGTVLNLMMNTPPKLVLHDIVLFLIALGILVRVKYETKEGKDEGLR